MVRMVLLVAALLGVCSVTTAQAPRQAAEAASGGVPTLILVNGKVAINDDAAPFAQALAVAGERIAAVGTTQEIRALAGPGTKVIDAGGRTVIPGLNDSHLHATRGGKYYNLELRWDGVPSLAEALDLVRRQAQRTPAGQWVRVQGGWSPFQFAERRLPTPAELTEASPDVPVFVLFLYSKGYLNKAGVEALGITADTAAPAGGRYELTPDGGAILHAEPSPMILYQMVGRLPAPTPEEQYSGTLYFYRDLNRLGLTSVVDAGGGGHAFPDDYGASIAYAKEASFPLRIGYYLFAQKPGRELADYTKWTAEQRLRFNLATVRLNGLTSQGAGENLVWSAGDFENFMAPRPELSDAHVPELTAVTKLLVSKQWPIRIHATYDQSISKILDVFEPVFREGGYTARWAIDHAETIGDANIGRVKAMGGAVAVQNRMAFAGEYFVEQYGAEAAASAPPLRKLLDAGIPVGAGTDATRVSSHNPWVSLYWLVSGRTVGGTLLAAPENRLSRREALHLYTVGSAWFTGEEAEKGRLMPGQLADFAVLSADYFEVGEEQIKGLHSVLTVVGGDVVYADVQLYPQHAPAPLPPVVPAWSPVAMPKE